MQMSPLLEQVTAYMRYELPPRPRPPWFAPGSTAALLLPPPVSGHWTQSMAPRDFFAVTSMPLPWRWSKMVRCRSVYSAAPTCVTATAPIMAAKALLRLPVRDQGSWVASLVSPAAFDRMHASRRLDPSTARMLRSFESGHTNPGQIDGLAGALEISPSHAVAMDSQAKYCVLASGKADLMLRMLSPSAPITGRRSGTRRQACWSSKKPAAWLPTLTVKRWISAQVVPWQIIAACSPRMAYCTRQFCRRCAR